MDAVISRLLEISLWGRVIVLAVLPLRLILRRAPKRVVCLLWMIAVLRLLVPFEIRSEWSLQPKPPEFAPPQVQQEEYFDSGTVWFPASPEDLENAVEYPLIQPPVSEKVTDSDALPWIWLMGMAALVAHGAISYFSLKRRVRDAVILDEGVWICPELDTAFVLGFFRPRIYLPVLESEERELVLLHERCHLRHLDHFWKLAAFAAVSIHWFNPLAWVAYVLLCRDMEVACDQETIRGMDNTKRKAYSAALLRCAVKRSGIAVCPVAFGEISVKERIIMVLNYKKPGFWVTIAAVAAALAVGFFLLTSPRGLTDAERCRDALEKWQEMDTYELRESGSNVGDYVLNEWFRRTYWAHDGAYLVYQELGEELGFWEHWEDGKAYICHTHSPDPDCQDQGWQEGEFSERDMIHWSMALQWDTLTIHHAESVDDGKTVQMTVEHPRLGPGTMTFCFDDAGELCSISRTYTMGNDEGLHSVCTDSVELVDRELDWIEKFFDQHGCHSGRE